MTNKTDIRYIHCCIDGSSAKKLTCAVSENAAPRVVKRKRKPCRVIRIDPVATLGIAVALVMLGAMLLGLSQAKAASARVNEMSDYVSQLSHENTELRQKYEESYDLENVRMTALAMGMVPRENVEKISLENIEEPIPEKADFFAKLGTFLSGLFA